MDPLRLENMMKRTLIFLTLLFLLSGCDKPSTGPEDPTATSLSSDEMISLDLASVDSGTAPESYDGGWITDLPAAIRFAKEKNKMIFMDFTGSDWCPPCKMLHSEVLTSSDFKALAKEHFILLELDFPRRIEQRETLKKANEKIASAAGIEGFPTIMVVDPNLNIRFKEVGYAPKDEYLAMLKKDLGI